MSGPAVLAVDIGSSSVRASLYTSRLRSIRSHQLGYRWRDYQDGRIELEPRQLERVVMRAIDQVLEGRRPSSVDAVAVAAFWHSLLGADAAGRPTTPLMPWSDLRAEAVSGRMRRNLDEKRIHARTGCRLHASYWPARLQWFRSHEPRIFERTTRWMGFGEWLQRRWLGASGVSSSQASATGLMRQQTNDWDAEILRVCGIEPDRLSPIVDMSGSTGPLAASLIRRWPALRRAQWLPVLGDGAVNNVGAGCTSLERAAIMIGTSGAVRLLWEPPPGQRIRIPFGLWRYGLDARRIVVGGALSNGGNVRDWILRTFRTSSSVEAAALGMEPDSHGLTVLPFLGGTRSPDYLPHARGAVAGLSFSTTPAHVLRAMLEGIGYRFALVIGELERVANFSEVVASGGGLERSTGWTQILADILGRPITLSGERELTSRGAAALALERLGVLNVTGLQPPRAAVLHPDTRRHLVYRRAIRRQSQFLRAAIDPSGRLPP